MIIYVDTSVVGGCFDLEFSPWSMAHFDQARSGKITIMISDLTTEEIRRAPDAVRNFLNTFPKNHLVRVKADHESVSLANFYIIEGAVNQKHSIDANHIALATVHHADFLASWNFKEMVNVYRIRRYNSINLKYGYGLIDIRTPKELVYER